MKKLKHIQLFENFNEAETPNMPDMEGMIFDWLPKDNQEQNPINANEEVPKETDLNGLMALAQDLKEAGKTEAVQEAGLYIAHKKNSGGGFTRLIASSLDPLLLDLSTFDSSMEKVSEFKDISPDAESIKDLSKGSSMLGRFGILGKDAEEEEM